MFSKRSSVTDKRPPLCLQVLIVAITLILVAVVIFLGSQTYRETRKMAIKQFNQQQLILARSAAIGLEAYFKELSFALSSLVKLPNVQQMAPECLQCMQHTYWSLPSRTSIRLLDNNGLLHFIYPFEGWRGELIGRDYSQEAYFQEIRETGRISFSGLIINEQGKKRIRIAVPVYLTSKTETVKIGEKTGVIVKPIDPDKLETGRVNGILVGSFDPHLIAQDFISPIVSGKTGYAWLLNEDGIFLAHQEEGFTGRNAFEVRVERNPTLSYEAIEQIQQRMIAGEEGVGRYISGWHRGQKGKIEKLVAYTPIYINGHILSVAVCAPISEVEEIIHITKHSALYTLAFVILALILGGALLAITSYRWSHSLKREVVKQTKKLRETRDYLNNLIRYANAPIIVWDSDKRVTIFNKAFEKMSGWTEAEIMEQSLDRLFPEESRSDSLQKIESASKGEYWETVEIPILRQDGKIRIGLWNSANIYSEDGQTLMATIAQGQDITERKRMQREIKERQIYLESVLRHAPDAIVTLDASNRIFEWNPGAEQLFGYTRDEILGKYVDDLLTRPDVRDEAIALTKQVLSGKQIPPLETVRYRKDGTPVNVIVAGSYIRIGDELQGSVAVYTDITERKRAEEQIRRLNSVLKAIRSVNQKIVAEKERDNLLQKICDVLKKARGYEGAWLGFLTDDKTFVMVKGSGLREDVSRFSEHVIGGDHPPCIKSALTQKDLIMVVTKPRECGDCFFKNVCVGKEAAIIRVERAGRLFGLLAILFAPNVIVSDEEKGLLKEVAGDIAIALYNKELEEESKRAEEELKESEKRFRDIAENAMEWIWEVDVNGKYTYASPMVEKILGYKPGEVLKKHFYDLFRPEDREELKKAAFDVFVEKKPFHEFINRNVHKNGKTVWLSTSGVPILDGKGNLLGYRGADIDITERKRAEEQMKASLKEKEVMLREIHHRVKNNLQIIISLLRIQSRHIKDKQALDIFKVSQDRIKSMALIHEKLYQSKDLARINFKEYIQGLTTHLFHSIGVRPADIKLDIKVKDISLDINTAIPCGLIINELISNAMIHAFPGGRKGKIRIDMHSPKKGYFILIVSDDGVGFPEKIDYLHPESLGMQLVNDLVEQIEGTIKLDRDKGTTFTIEF